MNDVVKCMLERRSIRKYNPKPITDEQLKTILEAWLYAPNAGGRQSPLIVVCRNEQINTALGNINKSAFCGQMSTKTAYVSKNQLSIADNASIISAFYDAPIVLHLFSLKNFLYASADCYAVAVNITLAAYSLGIGSCIVARAKETFASQYRPGNPQKMGYQQWV
ncbi:MAG: nitroreductase family protein [Deltaproteobacteria bacterium]|jgi:nitroreductase|nr:nitroreductase family protein [Deltaproteobacteria bacterium]